jgi:hypothetical protein
MAGLVRHRQTKEPVTDRPRLNHRATSRLYSFSENASQAVVEPTASKSPVRDRHLTIHRILIRTIGSSEWAQSLWYKAKKQGSCLSRRRVPG